MDNRGIVGLIPGGRKASLSSLRDHAEPGAHPNSYLLDNGVSFPRAQNARGVKVTVRLHVVLWLRINGGILLLFHTPEIALLDKSIVAKLIALQVTNRITARKFYVFQKLTNSLFLYGLFVKYDLYCKDAKDYKLR
jgi:hypothetical protein